MPVLSNPTSEGRSRRRGALMMTPILRSQSRQGGGLPSHQHRDKIYEHPCGREGDNPRPFSPARAARATAPLRSRLPETHERAGGKQTKAQPPTGPRGSFPVNPRTADMALRCGRGVTLPATFPLRAPLAECASPRFQNRANRRFVRRLTSSPASTSLRRVPRLSRF